VPVANTARTTLLALTGSVDVTVHFLPTRPFKSSSTDATFTNRCFISTLCLGIEFMKQYQVVIVRLTGKGRNDEDSLTDLLNERTRMGWDYYAMTQLDSERVSVVFTRDTEAA